MKTAIYYHEFAESIFLKFRESESDNFYRFVIDALEYNFRFLVYEKRAGLGALPVFDSKHTLKVSNNLEDTRGILLGLYSCLKSFAKSEYNAISFVGFNKMRPDRKYYETVFSVCLKDLGEENIELSQVLRKEPTPMELLVGEAMKQYVNL